jgi:hypothetical protein
MRLSGALLRQAWMKDKAVIIHIDALWRVKIDLSIASDQENLL